MRPLELAFRGLHSYREEQRIDFKELYAYGLFGIFGPTGAGKSTILDAITLALFGSVDRALRGKRGILNQEEQELSVFFSFELGGQVFRVERLYTRDKGDPFSVRARSARLVRGTGFKGDLEVLASTPQEVDLEIVRILGLRKEDFTRAVILPQGKFDEFLKLTGGERAKMLEYIFCLDRYGDELAEKAKNVFLSCEQRLSNIEAEEAGLGEASHEALLRARQMVAVQLKRKEELEGKVRAWRKLWEEMEDLRRLNERREQARAKYESLIQELCFWDERRKVLERASKAEPFCQDLIREEEIARELGGLREVKEQLQKRKESALEAWQHAEAELEEAEQRTKEELPLLRERLTALRLAVEKVAEKENLKAEIDSKAKELKVLQQKLEELGALQRDKSQVIAGLREEYGSLLEVMQVVEAKLKDKDRIEEALQILLQLEDREAELSYWQERCSEEKMRLKEELGRLELLMREKLPGAELQAPEEAYPAVEARIAQVKDRVDALRMEKERILLEEQAAMLAVTLRTGEPCPVCGSTDHPRPASREEAANRLKRVEQELEMANREYQESERWRDRVLRLATKLGAEYQNFKERMEPELKRLEVEVEEMSLAFSKASLGEEREAVRRLWGDLKENEKRLKELSHRRAVLEEEIRKAELEVRRIEEEINKLEVSQGSLKGQLTSLVTRIQRLEQEIREIALNQDPRVLLADTENAIRELEEAVRGCREAKDLAFKELTGVDKELLEVESRLKVLQEEEEALKERLEKNLAAAGFANRDEVRSALMEEAEKKALTRELQDFEHRLFAVQEELREVEEALRGKSFSLEDWERLKEQLQRGEEELLEVNRQLAVAQKELERIEQNHYRWLKLSEEKERIKRRRDLADTLRRILSGRKFVEFLAEEQLRDMALEASRRLGSLTGQRYALELDERCEFVLRDDFYGGQRRPVSSLSGGETFLTSLALALALSSQLQLKGRYPLGFFFLDEGFGTLDAEKLEVVLQALERLRLGQRLVGIISHVRELKERLPVYLEVVPPGPDGRGSRVRLVRNI